MKITEIEKKLDIAVFYGGRFQPMHVGHYQLYQTLVKKFGGDNVFIATTFGQKQQTMHAMDDYRTDPFTFGEKKDIASNMFDIKADHIIDTQPYRPDVAKVGKNPDSTAIILAFSEKDAGRLQETDKMRRLPKSIKQMQPASSGISYFITMPTNAGGMSATDFRNTMASQQDEKVKQSVFKKFFGNYDEEIFKFILNRLSGRLTGS